ncbi:MAG: glutamate--tRNA ligase [Clostridiales bacterium]|nr:glutamate--tRNA ligase [Clostridiales bacterium]
MTDNKYLADLLFPDIDKTVDYFEEKYPPRNLAEGAKVTRIAPSPTGFIHIGNLFGALVDERLAHQSGGIFYLRIEDTDQKRKVDGAVELIIDTFKRYGLSFDEGYTEDGGVGDYGPYRQRERAEIYQTVAKHLVEKGLAYPCFCTEEDLDKIRKSQLEAGENPGYYGKWARHRDCDVEEIERNLSAGKPFVLRLRSFGDISKTVKARDMIKGELEFPENNMDIILLKSDGIPTYHFAHVVDDHFMRTTHVVRGEEWLSTFPWHLQLFEYLGWKLPKFIHTAHMLKQEGTGKRKLSKRKDPEFGIEYYNKNGFEPEAVKEYLMTVLNSNFEEWRLQNKDKDIDEFKFTVNKMSSSGALFDMDKLIDVSKHVISKMDAETVYEKVSEWTKQYDPEFYLYFTANPDYTKEILSIGRGGKKPRKDIAVWSGVKEYMGFFFDKYFVPAESFPENLAKEDIVAVLSKYVSIFDPVDDQNTWFDKIKVLAGDLGFASEMKDYKQNPDAYKGSVADIAMILRIAVTGKTMSPDTYSVMRILGAEKVVSRILAALDIVRKGEN